MASKSKQYVDKSQALKDFTDSLRGRNGVECSNGKLATRHQSGHEELEWKDYVRGKDLARFLKGKQELLDTHTRPIESGRSQDDQIHDFVTKLLEHKLLLPAERKFKKPKPGKKKLVKFPRTLDYVPGAGWSEELFYCLSYDQPHGAWFYVGCVAVVLAVLGATLFPLAPYIVRLSVLYCLTGLLCIMLGTIAIRYVLWMAVWLPTGGHFWLLPNMMSEELPITQLFTPVIDWTPPGSDGSSSKSLALRGVVALLLAAAGYGLYAVGPDAATVKDNLTDAKDSVLGYFDIMAGNKQGITSGLNTTTTGINLNTTANGSSSGSSSSGDKAGSTDQNNEKHHHQQQQQQQQQEKAKEEKEDAASDWDPVFDTTADGVNSRSGDGDW